MNVRADMEAARAALQKHWGHTRFRAGQEEAITAILEGQDVLAMLPTGGGKSVCYQLPATLSEGLCLVISPLIALMSDQVAALGRRGISAGMIVGSMSRRQIDQTLTDAEFGKYDLLYLSPERLGTELFKARAPRLPVSMVAVDEAHCVSEWGDQFRPSYRRIPEGLSDLPKVPTIALTATAGPKVQRDILTLLNLNDPVVIKAGFDRPNIRFEVKHTDNKSKAVLEVLQDRPGSGLIYAATRKSSEEWAQMLQNRGHAAEPYHAGRRPSERDEVLNGWLQGRTRIVCATSAFGMGIDKPDVRFVLHPDLSASIESYYQEAGRAGRDGEDSLAMVIHSKRDLPLRERMIEASMPGPDQVQKVYSAWLDSERIGVGEESDERIELRMDALQNATGSNPGIIRASMDILEKAGYLISVPGRRSAQHRLKFALSPEELRAHLGSMSNLSLKDFMEVLTRQVSGNAFRSWETVDLASLERASRLPRNRVVDGLRYLDGKGLIHLEEANDELTYLLIQARVQRLDLREINLDANRTRTRKRLSHLAGYVKARTCRRQYLLEYFGQAAKSRCGNCDICLRQARELPLSEEETIAVLCHLNEGHDVESWRRSTSMERERMAKAVGQLIDDGLIEVRPGLELTYSVTERGMKLISD